MERVETNFDKPIGQGVIGKAYAGKAVINGKVKPVVAKYINEDFKPRQEHLNSENPAVVFYRTSGDVLRLNHYDYVINALLSLRGKFAKIKVARQEFRLDSNGESVLVSESFLKNGRTREVNFATEQPLRFFKRRQNALSAINFGVELLKKGVPLHADAFSIINGSRSFMIARDPDTLARGVLKLESSSGFLPAEWTFDFFKKVVNLHAYSGFAPAKQNELIENAFANRNVGTNKDKLKLNERRLVLLRKIIHEVNKAKISHDDFKYWLLLKLENYAVELEKSSRDIKKPHPLNYH